MTRRKSVCLKWTLVLIIVVLCPSVYLRPQESTAATPSSVSERSADNIIRHAETEHNIPISSHPEASSSREIKTKGPIRNSIKIVANQLLEKENMTVETPILGDTRIPPKLKNQIKQKVKVREEDGDEPAHPGEAVPITMDDLDQENKIMDNNESTTSNEGISTWVLVSNPSKSENIVSTEATKPEETQKKQKPAANKNKPKRPQNNKVVKRPIIGSTNKSDLVAGGSAINENVLNKLKDTVLSNVQKNKNNSIRPTSTTISSTISSTTEVITTKKETKTPSLIAPITAVTSKPKKKNKNKPKPTSTLTPIGDDSALLPMEPKEQEIELEISTPATTTKKPKRSTTRKKNKKRKTSTPKPETDTSVAEIKKTNKTKSVKPTKKPIVDTGAITTQLYNYLSREVMPSVGVGVLGLASLVGIAGYFLYPFATPVRRTFEVDKSDDLYKNNAEEYASEGNGQAEEEMLGTVLAGMPNYAKQKLNPYAGQTPYNSRYQVKKEQELRYRPVSTSYSPNYKVHYAQQKTGIAHAAVYPVNKPVNYNTYYPQYETRNAYTTEGKYSFEKSPKFTQYSAVEPIYAAPQIGPSEVSSFGSDTSNSVVYGVKPTSDSDFKPVYPYVSQFYNSDPTSNPITYSPTSMYLGSDDETESQNDSKFNENSSISSEVGDSKFVVGNVPKELVDSATPAVVPEHGPRKLRRRRSISSSLEELLTRKDSENDIFLSNEIDDSYSYPIRNLAPNEPIEVGVSSKDPISMLTSTSTDFNTEMETTPKIEIVESISTIPIINNKEENSTAEYDMPNEMDVSTKSFKIYEVFPSKNTEVTEQNSPLYSMKFEITTVRDIMTETTTELKSDTTSTMPTSVPVSTIKPIDHPDVITYPPLNQSGGFFSFLKRLVEFKYRLGLSILQTTSDSLNKYLRSMEETVQKVATASKS